MARSWLNRLRARVTRLAVPQRGGQPPDSGEERLAGARRRGLDAEEMAQQQRARYGDIVHVISLAAFRDAVGEEAWPEVAERVLTIAENVIRRHVQGRGVFNRQGETMFVIGLPGLPPATARRTVAAIIGEVGPKLIGAHFVGDDRSLVHAAELPAEQAVGAQGADTETLAAAVDTVRAEEPEPGPATAQAAGGAASDAAEAGPATPRGVVIQGGAESNRVDLTLRPVWNVAAERIDRYLCRPHRSVGGMVFSGARMYPDGGGAEFLGRLDRAALGLALAHLEAAAVRKVIVLAPLHWLSLSGPQGRRLLLMLQETPEALRLSRLDLYLTGVPAGTDAEALGRLLDPLGRLVRAVGVACDQIATRPAIKAGADLLGRDGDAARLDADGLGRLAAATGPDRPGFVLGLPDRGMLRAAAEAGLPLLSGPGLSSRELPEPGRNLPLDAKTALGG